MRRLLRAFRRACGANIWRPRSIATDARAVVRALRAAGRGAGDHAVEFPVLAGVSLRGAGADGRQRRDCSSTPPNVPGCALAIEIDLPRSRLSRQAFSRRCWSIMPAVEAVIAHPVVAAVTLTGSERAGTAVAAAGRRGAEENGARTGRLRPVHRAARCRRRGRPRKAAADARMHQRRAKLHRRQAIHRRSAMPSSSRKRSPRRCRRLKIGDPADRATQIGPLARLDLLRKSAPARSQRLDRRRRQAASSAGIACRGKGISMPPTLLADVRPGMPAFDEETFGPVAALIRADDVDDAIRLANATRYGLGASIWTRRRRAGREPDCRADRSRLRLHQRPGQIRSPPPLRRHQAQRLRPRAVRSWNPRVRQHQDGMGRRASLNPSVALCCRRWRKAARRNSVASSL